MVRILEKVVRWNLGNTQGITQYRRVNMIDDIIAHFEQMSKEGKSSCPCTYWTLVHSIEDLFKQIEINSKCSVG